MDRLKREWKETIIPEEVRLRARNLAWVMIQRRRRGRKTLGWVAAALTAVVMVALVWIWSGRDGHIAQISAPAPPKISHPAITVAEIDEPPVETPHVLNPKPVNKHVAQIPVIAPVEEPERIVLNFRLPESGARMIWIMDSRFHLNGGGE
jgi:hypothetical protein